MPLLFQDEVAYQADSALFFEALHESCWRVFLDSGQGNYASARFDIIAADPYLTLVTHDGVTEINENGKTHVSHEPPLQLLRKYLGFSYEEIGVPFAGGAIGYFSYDLAFCFEDWKGQKEVGGCLPKMAVGIYDWALVIDHHERRVHLVSFGRDKKKTVGLRKQLSRKFGDITKSKLSASFHISGELRSNTTREQYAGAFDRIQTYIREGDCYQVNFAQRFCVPAHGDAWHAYKTLRALNPAPYSAYLDLPFAKILSASPERFLSVNNQQAETKPIKGTRPRGMSLEQDKKIVEELKSSKKDLAENLMIVDLLRNDLSKVCLPMTVKAKKLFEVETFPTVHHLVSTVTGTLKPHCDAIDLIRACFPGGSVTGAPKYRAMQIIEELEPMHRELYCGAIGYIGFNGNMDTNIAIRTMVYQNNEISFWAGGGIVADSTVENEYQESLDKAAALVAVLKRHRNDSRQ